MRGGKILVCRSCRARQRGRQALQHLREREEGSAKPLISRGRKGCVALIGGCASWAKREFDEFRSGKLANPAAVQAWDRWLTANE